MECLDSKIGMIFMQSAVTALVHTIGACHLPNYCLLTPLMSPKDRKCKLIGLIPEVAAREDLVGLAFRWNSPLQLNPVPIPLRHYLQQLAGFCLGHNVSCMHSVQHLLSLSQKV